MLGLVEQVEEIFQASEKTVEEMPAVGSATDIGLVASVGKNTKTELAEKVVKKAEEKVKEQGTTPSS